MLQQIRTISQRHPRTINTLLVCISMVWALSILEAGFRFYLNCYQPTVANVMKRFTRWTSIDDTELQFQAHPYLAYVPSSIVYENNGMQIRNQFFSHEKPPGTIRIACLGGSTTMRKYPVYLQTYLNRWPGDVRFEVMDFGCNGWTLMESTINYLVRVAAFQPDIVILHHGANDCPPRQWPDYKPDYSHFRKSWEVPGFFLFARNYLSSSWLISYLLWRTGLSPFAIQNVAIRRVPREEIRKTPAPGSIDVIRRNLNNLAVLVQANGGQLLIAPMPSHSGRENPNVQQMIEEFNDTARAIANERGLAIAETDPLMQCRLDWFQDWVHVKQNGDYLKAQVYAMVIWELLGRYSNEEPFSARQIFSNRATAAPTSRDLELSWEFDSNRAKRYFVYVRESTKEPFRLLGKTRSGEEKSFRWKAEIPSSSSYLQPQFANGPQFGHHYLFRVNVIGKSDPPAAIETITSNRGIKTLERPVGE